ncbi:MAG: 50S ribosomal protein L10 [bacterium]
MAISKDKKVEIVAKLEKAVADAQSVVFVQFHKLTVSQVNTLRRSLQKEDVGYTVAKKTLIKRAFDTKGYEGEFPELPGEIAIAYSKDLLAPAHGVYDFMKENKDVLTIEGGVFEGKYLSKEEMMAIATIPGTQTLRGMFVNVINSPIQRFVIALDKIAETKN